MFWSSPGSNQTHGPATAALSAASSPFSEGPRELILNRLQEELQGRSAIRHDEDFYLHSSVQAQRREAPQPPLTERCHPFAPRPRFTFGAASRPARIRCHFA